MLFGLGVLGRLADRWGLSPIPLYLLAGLAFGAGGLVTLDAPDGFFDAGSEIGVVLLLLLLGLEYSASRAASPSSVSRRRSACSTSCSTACQEPSSRSRSAGVRSARWRCSASPAVSSSGIVAKVLTDLGRLGNRETPACSAILVLEDLAMAVYLPILTAVLASSGRC